MTARDIKRLIKIDAELLEAEAELERTVEEELRLNKRHLLLSRTIRYRVDKLKRMRANHVRNCSDRLSRQQTYSLILADRKKDELIADAEVKRIEQNIVQLVATQVLRPSNTTCEEIKIMNSALRRAKLILYNKTRAVDNWLAKSEMEIPMPRKRIQNIDFDIYLADHEPSVQMHEKQNNSVEIEFKPVISKPTNNATFELLTNPAHVELEPGAQAQALEEDSNVIELTTEELEARELEKMHSTQYKPVVID